MLCSLLHSSAAEGSTAGYLYTPHLVALDQCKPEYSQDLPDVMRHIQTPLVWESWKAALSEHPNRNYTEYLLSGIKNGFRIGYSHTTCKCRAARGNMVSTLENPEVVDEYLTKELQEGRIADITDNAGLLPIQTSPLGVIPPKTYPREVAPYFRSVQPKGGQCK